MLDVRSPRFLPLSLPTVFSMRGLKGIRVLLLTTLALALLLPAHAPAGAAACPAPGGSAIPQAPTPAGDVVVRGGGWGHSLGMSQYGAQGAARLGCNHEEILRTYYTGSVITTQSLARAVLVQLLNNGTSATLLAEGTGVSWHNVASGLRIAQPSGVTWSVTRTSTSLILRDNAGAQRMLIANGAELRAIELGTVARVRTMRGATQQVDLRMRNDYTRFVNTSTGLQSWQIIEDNARGIGVQKYLWGLAEVPSSWPQESLRAQAVAARTYLARRFDAASGAYLIGTTTASQHWTGYSQEAADAAAGGHWKRAVDATPGRVVTSSGGALLDTLYSSSHGGRSEDARYVYGNDVSYLRSVDDSRWDLASDNPYRTWAVGFTQAQLRQAFSMDTVTGISLGAQGSTERLAGALVTGTRAGSAVSTRYRGWDFRQLLGLRSPGVRSITWQTTAAPPTPLTGDWDGDSHDDVGWFSGGFFHLRGGDGTVRRFSFGRSTDTPVVGDWDGNGSLGVGVFRAGAWHLRNDLSSGPAQMSLNYGTTGDRPIVGRWPGSPGQGIGVTRGNQWILRHSVTSGVGQVILSYGRSTDGKVVGDWDGNGTDTPGVVRDRMWYLSNGVTGTADVSVSFGSPGDLPLPGDWDGTTTSTPGIVRGTLFAWRNDLLGGPATGSVTFAPQ